jgi:hypothetical protein
MKNRLIVFIGALLIVLCVLWYPSLKSQVEQTEEAHGEQVVGDPVLIRTQESLEAKKNESDRPQFVVLAFDGSRSIKMWEDSRAFAKEMAVKSPIHFTYFINAVYLLDPAHYSLFKAPGIQRGVSNIGFATSKADVLKRIEQINYAISEGHEIGSHNAGHFTGTNWIYEDWMDQFRLFDSIVYDVNKLNPEYSLNLKKGDIVGFRAPDLGVNNEMYRALKDEGFMYDTSKVDFGHSWPTKDEYGLWQFSLPTITIEDINTNKMRYTIGMDYSLYVLQTQAKDLVKKGTPEWDELYRVTLDSFIKYFYRNYKSNHAPVYMANHFSSWNDGVYWEAMKAFAREVCILKDVKCVSFKELAVYMNGLDSK